MKNEAQDDELRFQFGKNWQRFLRLLNEERINEAERSLNQVFPEDHLPGRTFLDIGSGSGLFSLAAMRLGTAKVHSFDFDQQSVECTHELKKRFYPDNHSWIVEKGDILDLDYIKKLGKWDIVYSYGVLHHTGNMWQALDNVACLVEPGGTLFLAIYNDQGRPSRIWARVKKMYNRMPRNLRFIILFPAFVILWWPIFREDLIAGRPFHTWLTYPKNRGMSPWEDVVDWVGGYPFEYAKPEKIFSFLHERGFQLEYLVTADSGGSTNNQYTFSLPDQG